MSSATPKANNGGGRKQNFEALQAKVEHARAAFEKASIAHAKIIADVPSGLPYSDGSLRIQRASEEFRRTMRAYSRAVRHLDDFVRTGRLPEEDPDA